MDTDVIRSTYNAGEALAELESGTNTAIVAFVHIGSFLVEVKETRDENGYLQERVHTVWRASDDLESREMVPRLWEEDLLLTIETVTCAAENAGWDCKDEYLVVADLMNQAAKYWEDYQKQNERTQAA